MYAAILVICMVGTPPHPSNPTCHGIEFQKTFYPNAEACLKAVPALIAKMDAQLKPHGYEAYRPPGHECAKKSAA